MKITFITVLIALLAGCGGGGSGDSSSSLNASGVTELEGTWVYSTGSHLTGGVCGLDVQGGYEERTTYVFTGTAISGTKETCWIAQGNTGAFIQNDSMTGTFSIGSIYMTAGPESYRELNVTAGGSTQYLGYWLSGNKFKTANPSASNDGTTPEKRFNVAASIYVSGVGLIEQPIFIKQ